MVHHTLFALAKKCTTAFIIQPISRVKGPTGTAHLLRTLRWWQLAPMRDP